MKAFLFTLLFSCLLSTRICLAEGADLATLQASAAKGDAAAELALGRAYHLGQMGLPVDYAKAADLYRKAAAQGNGKAMYNLGYLYHHGQGFPVDDTTAQHWFQKAADKGVPAAYLELGLSYLVSDEGLPIDHAAAAKWLKLAVVHQDTPRQEAMAEEALASLYEEGQGVDRDPKQAFALYSKAAELDNAKAKLGLGELYNDGEGVTKDLAKSYMWLKLAAAQDDPMAIHLLGEYTSSHHFTSEQMQQGTLMAAKYAHDHHDSTGHVHPIALGAGAPSAPATNAAPVSPSTPATNAPAAAQ
jgi:TPR repeat protein